MSKDKRIELTKAKLDRILQEEINKAMTIFIATAMDEFDWTEEDVARFSVRLDRYSEAIIDGVISIQKMAEIINEVTGMEIRWKR